MSTTTSNSTHQPSSTAQALASISAAAASLSAQQSSLASQAAALSGTASSSSSSPASYKIIGIILALVSGLFIGSSFVFKKKGLLISQSKVVAKGGEVGESHAYLKSPMWWAGMSLMIVGEICNFVAYAFADAILVTPMGALSVVICAILSSIFLKERLTFFGKLGCLLCILGATIIALNAPQEQAVSTIPEFQKLFLAPGFLVYASIIIISALLIVFVAAPRWGKNNMLVYISVCSIIGGLSVVATQGLGASIVTSIKGDNQFKHWFMYFLIGFVVCTLLTEINYLNKALELFNTAMVTPTYYVMFTFFTLVTSIILFQGLKAPILDIVTLVLGFLVICTGITLLQMSKVDPADLGLDARSTVFLGADKALEDDQGLAVEEPGIDGLRGFAGVIGSIHRSSLARRSVASHQEVQDRNAIRRRRQDTQNRNSALSTHEEAGPCAPNDLEMSTSGLKRHSLWDHPVDEDPTPRCDSPNSIQSRERVREEIRLQTLGKFQAGGDPAARSSSSKASSYPESSLTKSHGSDAFEVGTRSSVPAMNLVYPPPGLPSSIRFIESQHLSGGGREGSTGDTGEYRDPYEPGQQTVGPALAKLESSRKVRAIVRAPVTQPSGNPRTLSTFLGLTSNPESSSSHSGLPSSSRSRPPTMEFKPTDSAPTRRSKSKDRHQKHKYEEDGGVETRSLVRKDSQESEDSSSGGSGSLDEIRRREREERRRMDSMDAEEAMREMQGPPPILPAMSIQ